MYLRNVIRKRMSYTKEWVRYHSAALTERFVLYYVDYVVFDRGYKYVIVIVCNLCSGEGICGDCEDVRIRMIVAPRCAVGNRTVCSSW